jgi:hypothetical protein
MGAKTPSIFRMGQGRRGGAGPSSHLHGPPLPKFLGFKIRSCEEVSRVLINAQSCPLFRKSDIEPTSPNDRV